MDAKNQTLPYFTMNTRAIIVAIVAFLAGGFGGFLLQPSYGRMEQIRIQNEGLREALRRRRCEWGQPHTQSWRSAAADDAEWMECIDH